MSTPVNTPPTRSGFTLIELITVLVIAGIVAALAAPPMNSYVQRQRETRVANQIMNDLSQARMLAVRSGQRASVVRTSATSYTIGLEGAQNRRQVRLENDFPGISISFPQGGVVAFNSRGVVDTGTGTIGVTMRGRTQQLQVSATGRAYRASY